MSQAIAQDDPRFCAHVKQRRRAFAGDGSYYSKESCLRQIEWRREEARAPKIDPKGAYKISAISIRIERGAFADIELSLSKLGQPGLYTIALYCESTVDHINSPGRKFARTHCGNLVPDMSKIKYMDRKERFGRMVQSPTVKLGPEEETIEFRVRAKSFRRALADRRTGAAVYLTAELGLLIGEDGSVRDPDIDRAHYLDRFEVTLPANGHVVFTRLDTELD